MGNSIGTQRVNISLQEIFNYHNEQPLSVDSKDSNNSCRRNTHFVAYHRDDASSGGNDVVVSFLLTLC